MFKWVTRTDETSKVYRSTNKLDEGHKKNQELPDAKDPKDAYIQALENLALSKHKQKEELLVANEEKNQELEKLTKVVSELWDNVEGLKVELRSIQNAQRFDAVSKLRDMIDRVPNKSIKEDLQRQLYDVEDLVHTRSSRTDFKENPLTSKPGGINLESLF